jgi:hypothetical protein
MPVMKGFVALALVVALPGAAVLALDRASDARAAMPCCEADPCGEEIGRAADCCAVSPAAPDDRPALKVERASPSWALATSALPRIAPPARASRAPAASAVPPDTSPSRPLVLRL